MSTTAPCIAKLVFFLLVGRVLFAEDIDARLYNPAINPIQILYQTSTAPLEIVREGVPKAAIYYDLNALPINKGERSILAIAAEELQSHIKLATGAELPIVHEIPASGVAILLGSCETSQKLGVSTGDMKDGEFIVRSFPDRLLIVGKDKNPLMRDNLFQSGTLWGVYDVLERFLGVRWYYPGELGTLIQKQKNFIFPPVYYRDRPFFAKRFIYRFWGSLPPVPRSEDSKYISARFRLSDTSNIPTFCHTPKNWDKVYGQSHPEYFQMNADGNHVPPVWCYSEPAVLKQFLEDLDRFYSSGMKWKDPWGKWYPPKEKIIPLSPIDSLVQCHCQRCQQLVRNDSVLGYSSEVMGNFLYKLCVDAEKRWPDKLVYYLPYMNYTLPPNQIKMFPDNLSVTIAAMRTLANTKEPEIFRAEMEIINGWRKKVRNPLGFWLYTCWPADNTAAPFQYPHVIQKFISANRDSFGFFIDGGVDWARKHLTMYILSRCLWNPDFNVDAALEEYYSQMYPRSQKYMKEIFTLLIDGWEKSRWEPPLPDYHRVSLKNIHKESYPRSVVNQIESLIDQAMDISEERTLEHERVAFFKTALKPFFAESKAYHEEKNTRRTLHIYKVDKMPNMSGKLDDPLWQKPSSAEFITLNRDKPKPAHATTVRGMWIPKQGIILGFRMQEPEINKIKMKYIAHDEPIFTDDCIEMFFDPIGDLGKFYQICSNARGAIYDAAYYNLEGRWNSEGVVIKTCLQKDCWTMEVFIPFRTLNATKVNIGTRWPCNFSRSRWVQGFELTRFSTSYNPIYKCSNLTTLNFGNIEFGE